MSSINYRIFRSQFYIGAQPKLVNENWRSVSLSCGLILSYDKDLSVQEIMQQGQQYVLVGTAVQSVPGEPSPAVVLQHLQNSLHLPQQYASWAGRWILIAGEELHLDASGLLGCYYHVPDHGVAVASAAGVLSGCNEPDTFRLIKAGGAEYYPPPDSGFKGIRKLLPSQILNIQTGTIRFRNLQCHVPHLSYNETISFLAQLLTTTLANAFEGQNDQQIVLSLTGGHDSRTLMAALNYCNLPYKAVTFHSPNIGPADASLPQQLAKIAGIEHLKIRRGERKLENWHNFNIHTSGHSVEGDRELMLYQQFDKLDGNKDVLLRGGGFEVGRCAYYPWLPAAKIDGVGISAIQKGNAAQGQSWNKWLDWVAQTPQVTLDWRDRYYIEQRLAGWLSSTEQALDIVNLKRFIPANATLFFNIMLNIPEHIRKTKIHMQDLIRYMSPQLLQVPINPPVGFYYKQYRRVLFKLDKIKQKLNWA